MDLHIAEGQRRAWLWLAAVVPSLLLARAAHAQGLPALEPLNPVAASRSGLYFAPYRLPRPGWTVDFQLDYGSAIEYNLPTPRPAYLLDGEFLRLDVSVARDLGPKTFVEASVPLEGAYGGFLDGFLNWYHDFWGIQMPEREARPNGRFAYDLALPNGRDFTGAASALFLGDLRLSGGYRYNPFFQTLLSLTLPTTTGPDGYGRGTLSVSAINTYRLPFSGQFVFEGSLGLGYAPTHGVLADYQREFFLSASSGLRFRFWGRQSVYANLFYHSPYYDDVGLPALDRRELSLDFGWLLAGHNGHDVRLGLTEDLEPSGPGIDLVVRAGVSF